MAARGGKGPAIAVGGGAPPATSTGGGNGAATSAAPAARGGALRRPLRVGSLATGLRRRLWWPRGAPAGGVGGEGAQSKQGKAKEGDGAKEGPAAKVGGVAKEVNVGDEASGGDDAGSGDKVKDGDGDKKKEEEEKDEPQVSAMEALRTAWPWLVPRSTTDRCLLVVAILAEVGSDTCSFVGPLLLRYAMNGLTTSAAAVASTSAGGPEAAAVAAAATTTAAEQLPTMVTVPLWGPLSLPFFPSAAYQRPLVAIAGYMCTGYVAGLLSYAKSRAWAEAKRKMTRDLEVATFAHIHNLSLGWHLNRNSGRIIHIFYGGVTSVMQLLGLCSFQFLPILAQFFLNLAVLWRLGSWRLSLLAASSVALYAGVTYVGTRIERRMGREAFKADMREAGRAMDSLLNFENVKVFATEAVEVRRYRSLLRRKDERRGRSRMVSAIINHGKSLIQSLSVAIGMVMAGARVIDGTLSIADFVAAQTYMFRVFAPISYAAWTVEVWQTSILSLRKLVDLRREQPQVVDAPCAAPLVLHPTLNSKGGRVCFENVSFEYGGNSTGALHDISFTVPAGGTTAIVGPTGSGKSTLMRMLLRLFDVTAGRITIDGQDVSTVTQQSLRDSIGVVPQDCCLLRSSIRINIGYGRGGGEDVSDEDIMAAAGVAQLTDWIGRLPKGLDSVCGERGVRLSGGERQRVGIARMVVRAPAIVLLDESSSSLDSETERAMQGSLRKASEGATTIMIAHRLSTVVHADEILVLNGGRIVERGPHSQLLLIKDGKYRRMWELQHGGRDDKGSGEGEEEVPAANEVEYTVGDAVRNTKTGGEAEGGDDSAHPVANGVVGGDSGALCDAMAGNNGSAGAAGAAQGEEETPASAAVGSSAASEGATANGTGETADGGSG